MKRNVGFSDRLGYAFCADHKPEHSDLFTPEDSDICKTCKRIIVRVDDGDRGGDIIKSTPCRIF